MQTEAHERTPRRATQSEAIAAFRPTVPGITAVIPRRPSHVEILARASEDQARFQYARSSRGTPDELYIKGVIFA